MARLPVVCGVAIVGSADGPQVKLRNGSADRPRYEASQLSLTTCDVEGLVVVGLGLHSVVLCTIIQFQHFERWQTM